MTKSKKLFWVLLVINIIVTTSVFIGNLHTGSVLYAAECDPIDGAVPPDDPREDPIGCTGGCVNQCHSAWCENDDYGDVTGEPQPPGACWSATSWNQTCSVTNAITTTLTPYFEYYYDPGTVGLAGQSGSFYKVLPGDLTIDYSQPDRNLYNDSVCLDENYLFYLNGDSTLYTRPFIGFSNTLTGYPDNEFPIYATTCRDQHRSYGYMYIPASGYYDFGVGANHSSNQSAVLTMTWFTNSHAERGWDRWGNPTWTCVNESYGAYVGSCQGDLPCKYCESSEDWMCAANGLAVDETAWYCDNSPGYYLTRDYPTNPCEDGLGNVRIICSDNGSLSSCRRNCGGNLDFYMGVAGNGTSGSPYTPVSFDNSDEDGVLESNMATVSLTRMQYYNRNKVDYSWPVRSDDPGDQIVSLTRCSSNNRETIVYTTLNVTDLSKTNCEYDLFWTGSKYFNTGWYPFQIAMAEGGGGRVVDPMIYWKRRNPDGSWTAEAEFTNGSNGARINACSAGNLGENCNLHVTAPPSVVGGTTFDNVIVTNSNGGTPALSPINELTFSFAANGSSTNLISHGDVTGISIVPESGGYTVNGFSTQEVDENTTVTMTVTGTPNLGSTCSSSVNIQVTPPASWFQVDNMDATSLSQIVSPVPLGFDFDRGSYPGVPFSPAISVTPGDISATNWFVEDGVSTTTYSSNYFFNLAEDNVTHFNEFGNASPNEDDYIGTEEDGYEWYVFNGDGDFNVNEITVVPGRKIIVLVGTNGTPKNVNIMGDVTLQSSGNSMFMVITSGNINVDPSVSDIDGVFFANDTFSTGTEGDDSALTVTGSVVGRNNVSLDRDLGTLGSSTPAELFVYDPALLLNIPYIFNQRAMKWKEVAP